MAHLGQTKKILSKPGKRIKNKINRVISPRALPWSPAI